MQTNNTIINEQPIVSSDVSRREKAALKSLEKEAHRLDRVIEKDKKKLSKAEKKLIKDENKHKTGKTIQKDQALLREAERELNYDLAKHEQIEAKIHAVAVTDQFVAPVLQQPVGTHAINQPVGTHAINQHTNAGILPATVVSKEVLEERSVNHSGHTHNHSNLGHSDHSHGHHHGTHGHDHHSLSGHSHDHSNLGHSDHSHGHHHGTHGHEHSHGHHHQSHGQSTGVTETVKEVIVTKKEVIEGGGYSDLRNREGVTEVVVKRVYENDNQSNSISPVGTSNHANKAYVMEQPQLGTATAQVYQPQPPSNGAPMAAGGMPIQQGGMPMQQGGMPMQQGGMQGGMPMQQGGMPIQQGGMPMQQGGMPMQQGGMPMQQGGMQGGMPMQQGGMPMQQGGMPMQQGGMQGGMPIQQGGMQAQKPVGGVIQETVNTTTTTITTAPVGIAGIQKGAAPQQGFVQGPPLNQQTTVKGPN